VLIKSVSCIYQVLIRVPSANTAEVNGTLQGSHGPTYKLTFELESTKRFDLNDKTIDDVITLPGQSIRPENLITSHRMAVIRQEGSNGDREMMSAFFLAGFEVSVTIRHHFTTLTCLIRLLGLGCQYERSAARKRDLRLLQRNFFLWWI
jgi:hypothetical protein